LKSYKLRLLSSKKKKGKKKPTNKTKQNKTKQNKTKQNKTKQNKTKQNKTKQNKTKQNKNANGCWKCTYHKWKDFVALAPLAIEYADRPRTTKKLTRV
jgi:hypothetical protein